MKIQQLSKYPDFLPVIADWYYGEWGYLNPNAKQADIVKSLQCYLQDDGLPQALVALDQETPIGVAEIKYRELSLYPQYEHWLGGVFVKQERRKKSVGFELVKQALTLARAHNVAELYLQTLRLDGGLYCKLGWQAVEEFQHKGYTKLLMVYRF